MFAPAASAASAVAVIRVEQRLPVVVAGAAALDRLGDELLGIALAAVGGLLRDVLEDHVEPGAGGDIGDRRPHHPGAEDDQLLRPEGLDLIGPAALAVGLLEVEEERLDHVLRHLACRQVDEVAALDLER